MDIIHSLTLHMHTLYSQVQAPVPPRGNRPQEVVPFFPGAEAGRQRRYCPDPGDPGPAHHDGTNSSTKKSPASGRHPGPVTPPRNKKHYITATATTAQGETLSSSAPPSPPSRSKRQ
ncbi:hypothetical protein ILYODFUR_039112 [Ilyodon furcidens]|uniref:Uncharacterized protein n=1 Tax=Ilyodon furcidens TaxID=33524 RepID=A0ABV0UDD1_9TELE